MTISHIKTTSNGVKQVKGLKPDYVLVAAVVMLILLGIVILASVSASISQERFGSPTFFLFRHILFGLVPGILLGFLAFRIPLSYFRKWAFLVLLLSLFLMVLVFFPKIGISSGGANRWINIGFTSFQPSEFLKLSFIIYLAAWLATSTQKPKNFFSKTLIAFLVVISLISVLLVSQPNVSTLSIIILTGALMYFLSGTPVKHTLLIGAAGIASLAFLIKIAPYRLERFLVFLKPDLDPMGISYQIKQALITVGSGGILGKGLGMSVQRYGFLPQPMADSIFAIFSEETGFIGGLVLISLFLVFTWRGFEIAKKAQDKFCQLACLGISSWITLQAFINIGAMLGVLPLTGIPLPFISYGGSALVTELIGVGILLNISKHC